MPILTALLRGGSALVTPVAVAGAVTRPDRPVGRGRKRRASPVKELAEAAGIPILQPERVQDPASVEAILALRPHVLVVASYGQFLPRQLLESPPRQSLNLHPSLLPKYRGPSPISAAILAGERVTGTTLMLMSARLDAGPIVDQERTEVRSDETRGELEGRLALLSADLLLRDLPAWLSGTMNAIPQGEEAASYTRRISKDDGLINWTLPASVIDRQVRAYNPWPSAYTSWQGRQLRILEAVPAAGSGEAGNVRRTEGGDIAVGTGGGLLLLHRIQIAGGRPLAAAQFVRGYRRFLGSTLG